MVHSTDGNANRPASDSPAAGKNTFRSKRFNLYILTAVLFIAAASFLIMRSEATDGTPVGQPNVIYVTTVGSGDKNGSNWDNAYASNDLQTAINAAAASNDADASADAQVWVKTGEYTRSATLTLTTKAKVYGGFKGDETSLASRDVRIKGMMAFPMSADRATILNGNGGDFSIVKGGTGATSADTVLNGFTITGGKGTSQQGGGMANSSSSPTIENCTFYKNGNNNTAGAGIHNNGSSPVIKNTIFRENSTGNSVFGGAIANTASSNPIITGCSFINNTAHFTGGAILNKDSSRPVITNWHEMSE